MDAYAVERSRSSNEMLRLVAGLQSALTLEEVERAYLSNVVGVLDADGHGLYRLDPQTLAPVAISTDVTPSFVAKYTEYGRFDDPVMDRARELRRPRGQQPTGVVSGLAGVGRLLHPRRRRLLPFAACAVRDRRADVRHGDVCAASRSPRLRRA